jgi:alkanesulfonate monooxygenase SsuD/methylene tetrahydromethanopterin reductase-like flavin-dependent oxidoreductase (luciferase family)
LRGEHMDAWFHCENPGRARRRRFGARQPAKQALRSRPGVTAETAMAGGRMYAGNPDTVYRQIMEFYDKVGGFGHLIMVGKTGFTIHDEAIKNITLFSKEVLPRLREIKPVVAD